jgi:uncharacterized protein (DUF697 family)
MGVSLKLANVWRVIRDVDLEAIRKSARSRFDLLVISDDAAAAAELRALLSPGGDTTPHPWIQLLDPSSDVPPTAPAAAFLITRSSELPAALTRLRDRLEGRSIPVVTVHVGAAERQPLPARASGRVVRVAALDTTAVRALGEALVDAVPPDLRLALAVQLPALQPVVFDSTIEETARANASFALTTGLAEAVPVLTVPLNLGDMVMLTKNQLIMSYRIALAAGHDGQPRQMIAEILAVLGGGLLFRQIARQLVGLIPVIGLLPKIAIAYGGTWAIGRAIALWATEGHDVSTDTIRRFSQEGLERGKAVARRLLNERRQGTAEPARRSWRLGGILPGPRRRESGRSEHP